MKESLADRKRAANKERKKYAQPERDVLTIGIIEEDRKSVV